MTRRLSDINTEFERAVFIAVYRSRIQRQRRLLAKLVLIIKHSLRGLFFLWPAYVVLVALMFLPWMQERMLYLIALAPGMLVWFYIYARGARVDYQQCVHERILDKDFIKKLVFH